MLLFPLWSFAKEPRSPSETAFQPIRPERDYLPASGRLPLRLTWLSLREAWVGANRKHKHKLA